MNYLGESSLGVKVGWVNKFIGVSKPGPKKRRDFWKETFFGIKVGWMNKFVGVSKPGPKKRI